MLRILQKVVRRINKPSPLSSFFSVSKHFGSVNNCQNQTSFKVKKRKRETVWSNQRYTKQRYNILSILQWNCLLNCDEKETENVYSLFWWEVLEKRQNVWESHLPLHKLSNLVKIHLCLALRDVGLHGIFIVRKGNGQSLLSSLQSTPCVWNTHFSSICFDLLP